MPYAFAPSRSRALHHGAGLGHRQDYLRLYRVSEPRLARPDWLLIGGIGALLAGLTTASLVTWRGRWR